MLKIKDNIDLKELKKFIKKKKYKKTGVWTYYDNYTGKLLTIYVGFKTSNAHDADIEIDYNTKIIRSLKKCNLNLLYDLIKADLVEKIGSESNE